MIACEEVEEGVDRGICTALQYSTLQYSIQQHISLSLKHYPTTNTLSRPRLLSAIGNSIHSLQALAPPTLKPPRQSIQVVVTTPRVASLRGSGKSRTPSLFLSLFPSLFPLPSSLFPHARKPATAAAAGTAYVCIGS